MADILDQSLREFAKQGQGFWSRLFKAILGAFGVAGKPVKIFDQIMQKFGSANMRDLRGYVAGRVAPLEDMKTAFPKAAVDHFVRAILKSAEEFGATAEQLAAIDWENVDFRDLETNDPKKLLDLTQLPGLDDDMKEIMSRLSELIGDGSEFLKQVVRDHPEKKSERMQADKEPENPMFKQIEPMFNRFFKMLQFLNPTEKGDQKGQDSFWESARKTLSGEKLKKPDGTDATKMTGWRGVVQSAARFVVPKVVNTGNRIFGMLPQFVQRPIMNAAGNAASALAQQTGASAAGQAAAAAAGMGAARMAVAFRMVTLAGGLLASGIGLAVAGLKRLSSAAWDTTMRVTQYSGALSMAMAQSRVAELRRDIRTGQALSGVGATRIQSETNLANTMAPLEMAIGLMGNMIGTAFADIGAGLMDIANNLLIEPLVIGLAAITEGLGMLGLISEETRKNVVAGADKIVEAINNKDKQDAFDPLGGQDMPVRQLFNAMLNAPQPPPRVQNANNQPVVPNVAVPGLQNAAAQMRMNPGKL